MLLQMIFGNSPEKISLVIFIPTLKPNALGLQELSISRAIIVRTCQGHSTTLIHGQGTLVREMSLVVRCNVQMAFTTAVQCTLT